MDPDQEYWVKGVQVGSLFPKEGKHSLPETKPPIAEETEIPIF